MFLILGEFSEGCDVVGDGPGRLPSMRIDVKLVHDDGLLLLLVDFPVVGFWVERLKVAKYPDFLWLTNLEIHAGRLFAFLIC